MDVPRRNPVEAWFAALGPRDADRAEECGWRFRLTTVPRRAGAGSVVVALDPLLLTRTAMHGAR